METSPESLRKETPSSNGCRHEAQTGKPPSKPQKPPPAQAHLIGVVRRLGKLASIFLYIAHAPWIGAVPGRFLGLYIPEKKKVIKRGGKMGKGKTLRGKP